MNHRCVEPMELAELLALPADDPRRREAAACPRCDSLLLEMAAFLAGDEGPQDAGKARAERRLAAVLAGAMAARSEPSTGAAMSARMSAPMSAARAPTAHRSRRGRGWGWGLGLAASAAAVMFFVAREPLAPAGPSGVLRGGAPSVPAAGDLTITVAAGDREGRLLLSWPAVAGADHYVVEMFSAQLDTLASFGPLSEPRVAIDAALLRDVKDSQGSPARVLCRVRALGGAGQVAASRLADLTLP
jgi:hypothetical protein